MKSKARVLLEQIADRAFTPLPFCHAAPMEPSHLSFGWQGSTEIVVACGTCFDTEHKQVSIDSDERKQIADIIKLSGGNPTDYFREK